MTQFQKIKAPSIFPDESGETADVKNQAIFSMGIHKGRIFTRQDLDQMVENFNSLRQMVKVPAKLGHGKDNYGTRNGFPAVGWVDSIRRDGPYLIADFTKVPIAVANGIERQAWKTKSSEIMIDYNTNYTDPSGRNIGPVLVGVAFLGEELPAVPDLNDLDKLYKGAAMFSCPVNDVKTLEFSVEITKEEERAMTDKNDNKKEEEAADDASTLNNQPSEKTSDTEKVESFNDKNEESKEELEKAAKETVTVELAFDQLVKSLDVLANGGDDDAKKSVEDAVLYLKANYDIQKATSSQLRLMKWIADELKKNNVEVPVVFSAKEESETDTEEAKSEEKTESNKETDSKNEKESKEDENMDEKIKEAVDAAKLEFSKQMAELMAKMDTTTEQLRAKEVENSKLNSTIMELAKEHEVEKAKAFDKQVEDLVNGWVKSGRVAPAQVLSLTALAKDAAKATSVIEFSAEVIEDGKAVTKAVKKSPFELLNDFVNAIPENTKVDFSETAEDNDNEDNTVKARAANIAKANPNKYRVADKK